MTQQNPRDDAQDGRGNRAEVYADALKEQAEKASIRAKQKVTAQDILKRREEKRAKRAEPGGERGGKRAGWIRNGMGTALLLAAGVTLFVTSGVTAEAAEAEAASKAEIAELAQHVGYLENLGDSGQGDGAGAQGQDIPEELAKVRGIAAEVADLQNQFAALLAANPEDPGDGTPSKGFLDAVEHRRTLAPFFAEGTFLLEDERAYSPGSMLGLDTDEIDPRLQWYNRALDAGAYTWSVVSAAPAQSGDASEVDVTWLAQDEKSGDLLAWASASWTGSLNGFSNLTVGTTALGDEQNAVKPAAAKAGE